ncbi:MAG: hypothetical protein WBC44_05795 [Planctomycetaceae bacterium]
MLLRRFSSFAGLAIATASAAGAPPEPVEAPAPSASERNAAVPADVAADPDQERGLARAEFIDARQAFTNLLGSALSSEELADRAGNLSVRIQLRKAEERLREVETRIEEVESAGRADSDEARRLKERVVASQKEVTRLSDPAAVPEAENTAGLAAQALASRFQTSMAEETAYLADVLDIDELRERTRRYRRLAAVSQFVGGLRAMRQDRRQGDSREPRTRGEKSVDEAPAIVPAGDTAEPTDSSLGGASDAPPELPK